MKQIANIYTAKHSNTNYGEYSTTYAFISSPQSAKLGWSHNVTLLAASSQLNYCLREPLNIASEMTNMRSPAYSTKRPTCRCWTLSQSNTLENTKNTRYLTSNAAGETANNWQQQHTLWVRAAPHKSPFLSLQTRHTTLSKPRTTQPDYLPRPLDLIVTGANSFNSRALFYAPAHWPGSNAPRVAAYHWPSYWRWISARGPYSHTKIQPSYGSGRRGPDKLLQWRWWTVCWRRWLLNLWTL